MLILRLAALLAVCAIAGGFVTYLLTGNRRYLSFSWLVLKYGIILGLLAFALLAAERLLVVPF